MAQTWDRKRFSGFIARAILTLIFTAAAGMKFAALPFEVAGFERFGYPLWFMYVIGALQLLGAVLLWVRGFTRSRSDTARHPDGRRRRQPLVCG